MKKSLIIFLSAVFCVTSVWLDAQEPQTEQEYFNRVRSVMTDRPSTDNTADNPGAVHIRRTSVNIGSYIKILVVLALLIAAIYLIFLFMRRMLKIREDVGDGVQLLTSRTLGPGKQVQVVFVHGRYLILGVTNDNISLLGEITDPKEIEHIELYANEQAVESGQTFKDMISEMYNRLFGRKTAAEKTFNYETDEVDFLQRQKQKLNGADAAEDKNEE